MNIAFYTAVSGMAAYQQDLDKVAHNIANVNTNGFKPSKSNFENLLYTQVNVNQPGDNLVGHGVKVASQQVDMRDGTLLNTGRELDFAITGSGFFCIDGGNNVREYTRNGSFAIGSKGSKSYLVTEDGSYVLDKSKRKIELKPLPDSNLLDLSNLREKIGVFAVENPSGLQMGSNGRFLESESTGKIKGTNISTKNVTYDLLNGFVELSGTDLSNEMIQMIQSQRAYQLNARVVQTADTIEEVINNLR